MWRYVSRQNSVFRTSAEASRTCPTAQQAGVRRSAQFNEWQLLKSDGFLRYCTGGARCHDDL